MEENDKVIPLVKASSKRSPTSTPANPDDAKKAAQMILSCYPDYGKAPPEYIVNLIDVLSTYPARVLVRLASLRDGIVAKCAYLPSIAEVVSMADSLIFADEMDVARREMENQQRVKADKDREFWDGREKALALAREKYKSAFLDAEGMIRYIPAKERGEPISETQLELIMRRAGVRKLHET